MRLLHERYQGPKRRFLLLGRAGAWAMCVFALFACTPSAVFTPAKQQASGGGETDAAPQSRSQAPSDTTRISKRMRVSYYGGSDGLHGNKTASGERFDARAMTAAHRTLPFGTLLCVKNPVNGRSVVVRVNDRGPFCKTVDLDISAAAAEALGMRLIGIATLEVEEVGIQAR